MIEIKTKNKEAIFRWKTCFNKNIRVKCDYVALLYTYLQRS